MNRKFSIVFFVAVSIMAMLGSAVQARAQGTPTLKSSAFFGGAGDQRGTAISVSNGAIYISGNSPSDTGLILKYSVPPASTPTWFRAFDSGTGLLGIASTSEGAYVGGWNFSLTSDPVGGKEIKTLVSKFSLDGTSGSGPAGSIWTTGGPGNLGPFFSYSGVELFQSLTTALEGGSTFIYAAGGGQPCSYFAYLVAKYDSSGNFVTAATDSAVGISFGSCYVPGSGFSNALGVAVLNGNIYLAGNYAFEGSGPGVWKYDSNLNLLWRAKDTSVSGSYLGITAFGGSLYAVGYSNGASSLDYLIEKLDESGNVVWRTNTGGPNDDALTGVVGIGTRLFAVGYTRSEGSGGADAVILEIDPATGAILSTTLWGGTYDDIANGAATDGTDLFVVGESRSFASAAGNLVGSNDVVLLDYGITPPYAAQVQQPINPDGSSVFNVNRGVVPVKFTITLGGVPTCQLPPATISLVRTGGSAPGSIDESIYIQASDSGSNFRIDTSNCQYIYNLNAHSLGAGTYVVSISIGGSVVGSGTFGLK